MRLPNGEAGGGPARQTHCSHRGRGPPAALRRPAASAQEQPPAQPAAARRRLAAARAGARRAPPGRALQLNCLRELRRGFVTKGLVQVWDKEWFPSFGFGVKLWLRVCTYGESIG